MTKSTAQANPAPSSGPVGESSVLSDAHVGRRVIHGGAQRAAGFALANLLTAACAVILLRYLHVESFGRYGVVLAVVGVVYGISDMGLTATGTRELALCQTSAETRDVIAHILGLRVVVTGIGVLLGIAFGVVAGYQTELVVGIFIAGVGTLLQSIQAAMLMPLSVELRNGLLAVNQVLTQAVLLLGFVVLAVVGAGSCSVLCGSDRLRRCSARCCSAFGFEGASCGPTLDALARARTRAGGPASRDWDRARCPVPADSRDPHVADIRQTQPCRLLVTSTRVMGSWVGCRSWWFQSCSQ